MMNTHTGIRRNRHIESELQRNCIRWFRYQYPNHVLFAIPNGGARNPLEAAILKGEGVLAGVADLFLAYPSKNDAGSIIHGLFIEIKTSKGKLTEHQEDFGQRVWLIGYDYEVCRSLDEFMKVVRNYLKT